MKRRRRDGTSRPAKRRTIRFKPNPGTRALKMLRKLQKNEEVKYYDLTGQSSALAANANSVTLQNIVRQGSAYNQRIGNKYVIKSIYVRYTWGLGDAEVKGAIGRIALVYDRQPRGVALTMLNVFNTANIYGMINLDPQYRGRFIVLYDEVIDGDNYVNHKYKQIFIKKDLPVHCNADAGTIADIQVGSIYMIYYTNSNSANATLDWNFRIRFVDF